MAELDFENMTPGEALGGLLKETERILGQIFNSEDPEEGKVIDPIRLKDFETVISVFKDLFGPENVSSKLKPRWNSGGAYARRKRIELNEHDLSIFRDTLKKCKSIDVSALTNGDVEIVFGVGHLYKRKDGFSKPSDSAMLSDDEIYEQIKARVKERQESGNPYTPDEIYQMCIDGLGPGFDDSKYRPPIEGYVSLEEFAMDPDANRELFDEMYGE